jgi:hypothetical protein
VEVTEIPTIKADVCCGADVDKALENSDVAFLIGLTFPTAGLLLMMTKIIRMIPEATLHSEVAPRMDGVNEPEQMLTRMQAFARQLENQLTEWAREAHEEAMALLKEALAA